MSSTVGAEKTEEELRKEIDELYRQQREISERLRDPRGIRRGGLSGAGPRNIAANGGRQRGFVRPAERNDAEDRPPAKRRLSSAVVKVEDGEIAEDGSEDANDVQKNNAADNTGQNANANANANSRRGEKMQSNWTVRDTNQRPSKMDFDIPPAQHTPRVLPKDEDPSLVSRNKRMLGQLLGTLERFRKEDMQLSGSEAYMKRSDSLKRAEQRAREESEKLRQQEREQIAEKRKRDLTLRARIAAKAEEKKLELLFLRWSEHHKKLGNFIRTKAEPPIYYTFSKPLDQGATPSEEQKDQMFQEWKAARREELSQYQKQISEQYVANVDNELERWQNGRKNRRGNNMTANLQETMDKELETHQLEHGPKTRKIPGNNEDEDDVEDINAAEDDVMDDVLGVEENTKTEVGSGILHENVDETVRSEAAIGGTREN
ncbi:protein-protein interaction regulator family protein [Striga hermonthica]|uniref:Protein-protein interaction regulator family protein n=1 Tax=Striga hermonthica TaxID=68872 RepID=A0A9N7NYP6_STRHE|nr:protein-protein interaction regulator family protein [Striga hermonthica]